jgi:hypothetical protein
VINIVGLQSLTGSLVGTRKKENDTCLGRLEVGWFSLQGFLCARTVDFHSCLIIILY